MKMAIASGIRCLTCAPPLDIDFQDRRKPFSLNIINLLSTGAVAITVYLCPLEHIPSIDKLSKAFSGHEYVVLAVLLTCARRRVV